MHPVEKKITRGDTITQIVRQRNWVPWRSYKELIEYFDKILSSICDFFHAVHNIIHIWVLGYIFGIILVLIVSTQIIFIYFWTNGTLRFLGRGRKSPCSLDFTRISWTRDEGLWFLYVKHNTLFILNIEFAWIYVGKFT